MKYIVDIDALKDCLDMLEGIDFGDSKHVALRDVKRFIDKFPKDQLEIPKLLRCETSEPVYKDIEMMKRGILPPLKGELNDT